MIDRIVAWVLMLKARLSEERGQDLTEYALITGGIAIALVAAVAFFSGAVSTWFSDLAAWFNTLKP